MTFAVWEHFFPFTFRFHGKNTNLRGRMGSFAPDGIDAQKKRRRPFGPPPVAFSNARIGRGLIAGPWRFADAGVRRSGGPSDDPGGLACDL